MLEKLISKFCPRDNGGVHSCRGAGIGGYYTKTSVGTALGEGKEVREIDGELYVFEKPLRANVSLIKARRLIR